MILVRHGQSEFNLHFGRTRVDPGIRDPALTDLGQAQARETAAALVGLGIRRLVSSPYTRAVQTASVIADALGLAITITPLVGERAAFSCDFGSHPDDLARRWPHVAFDHLAPQWWPDHEESEEALLRRCADFQRVAEDWDDRDHVVVVSHWGFIRGLTGMPVKNCTAVRVGRGSPPDASVVHEPES